MKTISTHAGEIYNYGFDHKPWLAVGDVLTEAVSVSLVKTVPADAPAASIGVFGLVSGKIVAEIGVPSDAPVGTKYTFEAVAGSEMGSGLKLKGELEVVD